MVSAVNEKAGNGPNEIVRPVVNFSPSLWGDKFLNYAPDTQVREKYFKEIEVLKDEVKSMISSCGSTMEETMNLIETLGRLGISYHFADEIEEKLEKIFNLYTNNFKDIESYDLYTTALHFRLFRQHGYHISTDIFSKFMDKNENFQDTLKSDVKGLLSLYEAAYLRIHGEPILEHALVFTTTNLKSIAPDLDSCLRKQVMHALVQPLHMGIPRIETRTFISIYEENESANESLLKFAKLDYNLSQILYKEELHELSKWWKELDLVSKLPYVRDRLVECFFWAIATYHEPQYSRARIMLTKTIVMTSMIDDTYDAYGTIEELNIFTEAIERWDISEIGRLPEYMRPLYKTLLELYEGFEEELMDEGRLYAVYYAIQTLKELVKSYHVEAKWFIEGYLPPFAVYMENAIITCTYFYHGITCLLGMKSVTKEEFEWVYKKPKILIASSIKCRVVDDISTYQVEKERGQCATGIGCYMKENCVTKEEAMNKFVEMATNAWKDTNVEWLKPYSRNVIMRILNLDRVIEVAYKNNEDGYTKPEKFLKNHMIAMFVDPIKIN